MRVRGHDGHPPNEIADLPAVLARRNRDMGIDEVIGHRMVAGAREDAKVLSLGTWLDANRTHQVPPKIEIRQEAS
jgi:hypothetical protein